MCGCRSNFAADSKNYQYAERNSLQRKYVTAPNHHTINLIRL